jgi:hypothetical protein
MKKFFIVLIISISSLASIAQVAGNASYANQRRQVQTNDLVPDNQTTEISIRALAIVPTERYTAVFDYKQNGTNTDEIVKAFQAKLNILHKLLTADKLASDFDNDLISFLPVFTVQTKKSLFRSETIETPVGYEMQQNLSVSYTKAADLLKIISIMAQNGIYNLLKVNYYSSQTTAYTDSLRAKSYDLLKTRRIQLKQAGVVLNETNATIAEEYQISQPADMYQQVNIPRLETDELKQITNYAASTETSRLYQNLETQEYDIIVGQPENQPCIQISYQLVQQNPIPAVPQIRYLIQTPTGFQAIDPKK